MKNMPQMPSSKEGIDKLDTPVHYEEKKVEILTPKSDSNSEVKVKPLAKSGIEVVALRAGFFKQMRYKEGDKFIIKSLDQVGEWMKCLDPVEENKRLEKYKEKAKK